MIIKAKSRKGKNKIHEGLGTDVVVLLRNHSAVLVAPLNEPSISSKFVRWIQLIDDVDFTILPIS